MSRILSRVLVAAALVMLVAGGAQAADQKQPIKIGAFFALSGPAAPIGTPTKLVAEMAVDQINKAGGINGRPLELIIGDTESDPAKAATIAKKFIHSDKVAAIIGPTSTGEGMQVKKIVEEAGIPIFMTVGGDPPIMKETGPFTYIFKSPQRSSTAVKKVFEYLKEKKLTKVAMFTASDPFGKDGAVWLEKLAPDYGITFVAKESFGPKDTDMTPQLTKIKNANPDAIICWTIGPAGAIVAKNKAQLGLTTPLFQCHGQPGPEYIQLAGKASEGDRMPSTKLMAAAQLPDSDPQKKVIQNFIQLYHGYLPSGQAVPHQHPLGLRLGRHHHCGRRHAEGGHRPQGPARRHRGDQGLRGGVRDLYPEPRGPQRPGPGFHGHHRRQGRQVRDGEIEPPSQP